MVLTPGTRISSYEILAPIGAGGMGEVYQAKDQKLGRDVAIKVLPEEFAKDTDRVARFQREAKLLASLNHPNIASIYGLEESGGTIFLVLELVEGETLADQLKRGPIPVEDALKFALQISEALEAAHEKGIIHRDLKPANIKVTPDGKVKVLDFGLAKAFAPEQGDLNLSNSPTLSNAATQLGVILGTAAYMSPEQARGKSVDKRTDIWAFGCVLFEMLTGQAAFQGEDVTEILAAVVKSGANLDLLPADTHPRVREIISRCLQKDVKKRYQDVGDVRYELEQVLADPSGAPTQQATTTEARMKPRTMLPWLAAAIILTAIIAGMVVWRVRPREPLLVTRFDYVLPDEAQQAVSVRSDTILALSPDGRQFVYSTGKGLFLRSMDRSEVRRISSADDNPSNPLFSPDGQRVAYWSEADRKLKTIAISGGAPIALCNFGVVLGASWDADGAIVYSEEGKGILRISVKGGIPETLIDAKGEAFYHPRLLPDGKSVLFTVGPYPYQIAVQSLESKKRKVLFAGDCASYLPTGHIVYALANNLYAIPFDLNKLEVTGESVSMAEGVFRSSSVYAPEFAVSASGTMVYMFETANSATERKLVWVDREGKEELFTAPANSYSGPRISPDGKRIALAIRTGDNGNIWIWDLVRGSLTRLTLAGFLDNSPLWTPDGKRIVFASNRAGGGYFHVLWTAADGSGDVAQLGLGSTALNDWPRCWSGDGNTLILTCGRNAYDIGVVSMKGDQTPKLLLSGKANEINPHISPDRRWLSYASDESGKYEVYVRPFPDVSKAKWQVSTSGGDSPLWSPDGRELFYRNGDAVMAVSVKTDPTFSLETPRTLFRGTYVSVDPVELGSAFEAWDISPDGRRFLMMKGSGPATASKGLRFNIVLNWFEELKQRMPTK
jgi:Tol biopolymer transport system component